MANEKKYPLTVLGLYKTATEGNARSQILTKEFADRACAAIQAAIGGKIALKQVPSVVKRDKGDTFPDMFIEAVTPDLLAEERARMRALNPEGTIGRNNTTTSGDDAL